MFVLDGLVHWKMDDFHWATETLPMKFSQCMSLPNFSVAIISHREECFRYTPLADDRKIRKWWAFANAFKQCLQYFRAHHYWPEFVKPCDYLLSTGTLTVGFLPNHPCFIDMTIMRGHSNSRVTRLDDPVFLPKTKNEELDRWDDILFISKKKKNLTSTITVTIQFSIVSKSRTEDCYWQIRPNTI